MITFVFHPSLLLQVPEDDYTIPLGQAEVLRQGSDVTVVGWGGQLRVLEKVGREEGREGGREGGVPFLQARRKFCGRAAM